ncbi:MAG: hypothetical protein ACRD96_06200 [Bryobacteraceae bacterium]
MDGCQGQQRLAQVAHDRRIAVALLDVVLDRADDADEVAEALKPEALERAL